MYLRKVNLEPKKWLTQKKVPEKVKPADIMILALQSSNQLGILALICYESLGKLISEWQDSRNNKDSLFEFIIPVALSNRGWLGRKTHSPQALRDMDSGATMAQLYLV